MGKSGPLRKNSLARKIILLLALVGNYYETYFNYKLIRRSLYHGYRCRSNLYNSVNNLLSVGDIEKKIVNGKIVLRLSSQGDAKIHQDLNFFKFGEQKWDGFWRMVIFDIKEKNRRSRRTLRDKLQELGFGLWQKSVYLSLFNIEDEINDFLENAKLYGSAYCLKAEKIGKNDDREIANSVFKLEKLENEYNEINDCFKDMISDLENEEINLSKITKCINNYYATIWKDPGLPKELLPYSWVGEKVRKSFSGLIHLLNKENLKIKVSEVSTN